MATSTSPDSDPSEALVSEGSSPSVEGSSQHGEDELDGRSRPSSLQINQPPCVLEMAVTQFDTARVTSLLEDQQDVDVSERNQDGHNVLHEMVYKYVTLHHRKRAEVKDSFVEILSKLVQKGLDINAPIQHSSTGTHLKEVKYTALHIAACHHDSREVITTILSCGGKVNTEDGHKQTALHLATDQLMLSNMERLLEAGAEPNHQDEYGQTPLHMAVKGRHKPLDIVNLLLKSGAEVNMKDATGKTALHLAAKHSNVKVMRELIQHDGDVNITDATGQSPAHYACTYDCSGAILKDLISAKADMNIQDDISLESPLHKAVRYNMKENLLLLCRSDLVDLNITDISGDTVLHKAARFNDWAVWTAMLNNNGDVTRVNSLGVTALQLLKRHNNKLTMLIEKYVSDEPEW